MKLMINLAEETSSLSAAKAPKFKIQKVGSKRSLVIAKSASRDFKKALGLAAKAHKGVGVLQKQRASLASAQEKLSKATAMNKDHMRGLVKAAKGKIADTKKLIKQYNSEASKLLKSNFGLAITVPFSTEDLCSPTKAKSAKMKTFDGLKVKGMTGFVKTVVSVKDSDITGKTTKEVKNKDGSTRKSAFKSLDEIEDSMGGKKKPYQKLPKDPKAHAELMKKFKSEDRAHLKNVNAAFGTKLKKSDLKGAKVASNKLGALKVTLRDGTVHTIKGSDAKKAGINKDILDLIIPE